MKIFAIDPGTTQSGWVIYDSPAHAVVEKGVTDNHALLSMLEDARESSASEGARILSGCVMGIEMIASQGMMVGAEVFETVVWIGMFMHAWQDGYDNVVRVTRNQCKVHVCGSVKAKDTNVRQALIDLFPATGGGKKEHQVGTAKAPGPLFGMNSHMWPALAVALTVHDKLKGKNNATPSTPRQRPAPRRVSLL